MIALLSFLNDPNRYQWWWNGESTRELKWRNLPLSCFISFWKAHANEIQKKLQKSQKNIHLNIAKKKNLLNLVSNESSTQTKWWWWKHPRFSFRNSESENSFFLSLWKSLCCIGLIVPFIVIESLLINCKPKGQLHRLVNHLIIWKSLFQLNNLTFQFQFGILISPWLGCNLCNFVFGIDLDDYDNCENRKWFHFLQMIANWIGRHWKWLGSTHCETIISIF